MAYINGNEIFFGVVGTVGADATFDLGELGLSDVVIGGAAVSIETDTTDICAALEIGAAKFRFVLSMDGTAVAAWCAATALYAQNVYMCNYIGVLNNTPLLLEIIVDEIAVSVKVTPYDILNPVTADDNDKIMQVVDGVPQFVALEESAIKNYIDNYINEALGGDY